MGSTLWMTGNGHRVHTGCAYDLTSLLIDDEDYEKEDEHVEEWEEMLRDRIRRINLEKRERDSGQEELESPLKHMKR